MTAEIAIMNKSAVALAADSAVTFSVNGEKKVYQSINKLFSLSKYHPVGLMVYGNAEFMGIDWETIVKVYRASLKHRAFDTLREHAYNFLEFLSTNREFFDDESQNAFVQQAIGTEYSSIRDRVIDEIDNEILHSKQISSSSIRETVRSVVTDRRSYLAKRDDIKLINGSTLPSTLTDDIRDSYQPAINRVKKMVFEDLPLDSGISRKLNDIALLVLTKDGASGSASGVVIAGYGARQIFPALEEFHIDGVFCNIFKFGQRRSRVVGRKRTASLMPFAQSEMVVAFMEGVDPEYQEFVDDTVRTMLDRYSSTLLDLLGPRSSAKMDEYLQSVSKANEDLTSYFKEQTRIFRRRNFVNPVVRIVDALPKSELAAMAESLVNLTSFRRHVTPDAETVGGDIDVAIISRGDGFVWIKRKHYFKPELNQSFFANYFQEVDSHAKKIEE